MGESLSEITGNASRLREYRDRMPTSAADVRRPGPMPARPAADGRGPVPSPLRPAAASTLAPAWLHGDPGTARVVAVFERAAYLLRDDEVLPVLAPGALALPGGLRVGHVTDLLALRLRAGDEVLAGLGEVVAADGGLVVRRTWRPWAAPSAALPADASERALAAIDATPDLTDDLPPDVLAEAAQVLPRGRVEALLGLGPGLTPAGDDVLCGLLLGLRATGREADRARLEARVGAVLGRTTALSATLLTQAAAGYAVPPVVDLLHAWHRPTATADDLAELVDEVASVGHTSGRALLLGLRTALAPHRPASYAIPT